jgi:hypothetical protein
MGATGVPLGGETGGIMGPVGPAGPSGCVPLWQPQFAGGLSPMLTTAGMGSVGLEGAGRAAGPPLGGYIVPFRAQLASPVVVVVWKHRAVGLRPRGGREESSDVQQDIVAMPLTQCAMKDWANESPMQ